MKSLAHVLQNKYMRLILDAGNVFAEAELQRATALVASFTLDSYRSHRPGPSIKLIVKLMEVMMKPNGIRPPQKERNM